MAGKLSANTVVLDENLLPVSLYEGDSVPSWAAEQVGDHLTGKAKPDKDEKDDEGDKPTPPEPKRSTAHKS